MIVLYLMVSVAMGAKPPERPKPQPPIQDQCPEAIPLKEGQTALCRGVLLPTSWVADYELLATHTKYLERLYEIDTTSLEHELQYNKLMLKQAQKPVPVWEKNNFWTGVGVVIGGAAVIGGGYAIGAAKGGQRAH